MITNRCERFVRGCFVAAIILAFCLQDTARSCGPFFPNMIIRQREKALLEGPVGRFHTEIDRIIQTVGTPFCAVIASGDSVYRHTARTDLKQLETVLLEIEQSPSLTEVQLSLYARLRKVLVNHAEALKVWRQRGVDQSIESAPVLPETLPTIPQLPAEFAFYVAGAVAYYRGDVESARSAWQEILALPEMQRRYRSTWAAFMLGRTWLEEAPEQSIPWFQQTRRLAEEGFVDGIGLGAASLGQEALAELRLKHHVRAIRLYVEQYATGDPSALLSLQVATGRILSQSDPEELEAAARDTIVRDILTAFLISRDRFQLYPVPNFAFAWLHAVQSIEGSVENADRLALIAYKAGDMTSAERWIQLSPKGSPLARWVHAKLLLRRGELEEATGLLSELCRYFPTAEEWYKHSDTGTIFYRHCHVELPRATLGELGLLHLARGEYIEALDALLGSGYWLDAAYVAERVLNPDELKAYVELQYPSGPTPSAGQPVSPPESIRYVLARRLARLGRWEEAIIYYPASVRADLEQYVNLLRAGSDTDSQKAARASALWQVARITREKGKYLLSTEVEPDWFGLYQGAYSLSTPACLQDPSDSAQVDFRTRDEIDRCTRHGVYPEKRWHYRYVAAELAWNAAHLLPEEDERAARILCTAGSWLKNGDPAFADRFYKAMVRRCGRTRLGQEADRLRWFPRIKEDSPL